jgi:glycopeptide antibiotics resistance protein
VTSASVHRARLAGWFLLLASVVLVLGATLGQGIGGARSASLRPGHTLALELHEVPARIAMVNIGGNVAMFVPIGFLLVTALRDSVRRAVVGGLLLSATIECCQYRIGRAADVDDVLLNTAGALLGALVAAIAVRLAGRSARDPVSG